MADSPLNKAAGQRMLEMGVAPSPDTDSAPMAAQALGTAMNAALRSDTKAI